MCGRFTVLTPAEIAEAIRAVELRRRCEPLSHGTTPRPHVRPGGRIAAINAVFQPVERTWGFEFDWHKGPVFNTRVESLLSATRTWRDAGREGRCIIPAASFFETHANETVANPKTGRPMKRAYEFAAPDGTALLLAGVAAQDACSIVTTEPNGFVAPVHARMPLTLTPDEAADWLDPSWNDAQLQELWHHLADRSRFGLAVAPEQLRAAPSNDEQLSLF